MLAKKENQSRFICLFSKILFSLSLASYSKEWIAKYPPNYDMRKRFYPVFGKRSIDEHTLAEEKFFLQHHRSTRHTLYKKVSQYLDAKGKPGHDCVLRALCESGKRKNDEPDDFLREIMKAVFSIPSTHEKVEDYTHKSYDHAHGFTGDCAKRFSQCKHSIWSEEFNF
jgi:hypothetical protein